MEKGESKIVKMAEPVVHESVGKINESIILKSIYEPVNGV